MVILGRPQLKFFGFAIKKYINVLQQVSGRKYHELGMPVWKSFLNSWVLRLRKTTSMIEKTTPGPTRRKGGHESLFDRWAKQWTKTLKILNIFFFKIVVTKLKINTVFCRLFFDSYSTWDLLTYSGPVYEVFHTTRHLRGTDFRHGGWSP